MTTQTLNWKPETGVTGPVSLDTESLWDWRWSIVMVMIPNFYGLRSKN